ncbi:hypothetical protein [Glycomyces terrestris]|uniref:Uncharacterized protein n=1 Tax=Glycomyces terrestris TaxID=2493553 RepID=A0A426UXN4_9ACTN|nr:hypothetical protein [Glycomyces terrestris]RRR99266.1 hypothetical protein EIW28_11090 [Glycomyces terrestris]
MRRPDFIGTAAASAAAAVLAGSVFTGGTAVHAEPPASAGDPAATAVILPTGDRVTVLPNGTTAIDPAAGREDAAFLTPPSPSGDLVVVPTDRVAAIQAGDEDPRRYNVSELLRAGETDAAAARESELDEREYAGLVPASAATAAAAADAETRRLDLTLLNRHGKAPDGSWVLWADQDSEAFDFIPVDEYGHGAADLPPGDYVVVSGFWSDPTDTARGQHVFGMTAVTIGEEPVSLVLDGAAAAPVAVAVEQEDAQLLTGAISIDARSEDNYLGYGTFAGPRIDAYLLPEPDLPGFELGFLYQPVLASPAGADDPYAYHLAFHDPAGFPADPAYAVDDDDLAEVETEYRHLGTPGAGQTCDYGDYTGRQIGMGFCLLVDTAVPSERTVYYTAGPEIHWDSSLQAGELDAEGFLLDGFVNAQEAVFAPGETERVMPRGGLSAAVSYAVRADEDGGQVLGAALGLVGGGNDEVLILVGAKGNATLSRDGETIAAAEGMDFYWENLLAALPAGDAGRYTITAETTAPSTVNRFGTSATAAWTFDSAPVAAGGVEEIPLPVVQLASDDIEGGYAPRRGCQELTLTLAANEDGPVVHAVDMTFEVSYDDGATWTSVDLDRDGDTAAAALVHPRGARWVSVRMTAVDDRGTEVEHTAIRAYGLR